MTITTVTDIDRQIAARMVMLDQATGDEAIEVHKMVIDNLLDRRLNIMATNG